MDNRTEKMQELMKNEEFVKKLITIENPEDVQVYFEDNGLEMTLDEVKELGTMLGKVVKGEVTAEQLEKSADGELSEDELKNVAGGSLVAAGITILVGTALGAGGLTYAFNEDFQETVNNVVDALFSW